MTSSPSHPGQPKPARHAVLNVESEPFGQPGSGGAAGASELEGSAGLEASDEELIRGVAGGDAAAFEVIYERHVRAVFGMAVRVLRDPAQSEEVAQEVLVEVWRTAARFDPAQGSLRAWIITMARRRAIDRVRSAHSMDLREVRAAVADHTPDFDQVSETVQTRMEHQRVRQCLDTLTQTQRQSIELAYFGGFTYREVSDQLSLPLGTIKTRMRDGMIRLRDCLGVM